MQELKTWNFSSKIIKFMIFQLEIMVYKEKLIILNMNKKKNLNI